MEDKEEQLPSPSAPNTEQEDDTSGDDKKYSFILPSMPPQDRDHPASQLPAPQAVLPPPYPSMQGYEQMSGYMQPPATYPMSESRRVGAGGILPSSSPLGHPPYSAAATGTGAHSLLPSTGAPPSVAIPPMNSYPGFGPYQSNPYGYGTSGQGYPYDTSAMMPYSSSGVSQSQTPYATSQVAAGTVSPMMPPVSSYGGAQGHPYYGSGYSQQYEGQQSFDYYGARQRGQGYRRGGDQPSNRSRATNPGKPIFKDKNRSDGPEGANLFVFHIPNNMTNADLYELFKPFGNILSANIMTEKNTGRGRGFGFVSYDSPGPAAEAINHLNGLQIHGKRLKVELKLNQSRAESPYSSYPASGLLAPTYTMQMEYTGASQANPYQRNTAQEQSSVNSMMPRDYTRPFYPHPSQGNAHSDHPPAEFAPTQEAGPSHPYQNKRNARSGHPSGDFVPVQEARPSQPSQNEFPLPTTGFVPVPESTVAASETDRPPVLPPPLHTSDQGSEASGDPPRSSTLPSPLDDMEAIHRALPDPEK